MNSTLRIELDGTLITGRVDGIENFVVTIRNQDEEGKIAHSFSSELTFYDDGYNIIKNKLINSWSGFGDFVSVKLYDSYCGQVVFDGKIQGDSIDWCEPGCYVSANIIEVDPVSSCIQNTTIWDNRNGFLNRQHNGIEYCLQIRPLFLHVVFAFLMLLLKALLDFITLLLTIPIALIYAMCFVIQRLCRVLACNAPDCDNPINNPVELWELTAEIKNQLGQCEHKHPAAYVRNYIKNVCDVCGLTFQSSILNDPNSLYYDLTLLSAQVKKGINASDPNILIQDNLPVETLTTLMDSYLKPLFNAEYRIANNTLYFERKDYFFNSNNIWVDVEDLMNRGLVEDNLVCFSWIDKDRPAYANFQYTMDASEYIGNEVRRRWEDTVEWNPAPINPSQKGGLEVLVGSSAARTLIDGLDFDAGGTAQALITLLFPLQNPNPRTMIMSQHRAFNYKFIITDSRFIKNNYSDAILGNGNIGVDPNERVNYPMWFREGYNNNLYSLFHYINNPRLPGATNYNFKFTFGFDCLTYQNFSFDKTVSLVMGGQVKYGQVKELSVDFNKRTITVNGIV
jgi:hypothetical protein